MTVKYFCGALLPCLMVSATSYAVNFDEIVAELEAQGALESAQPAAVEVWIFNAAYFAGALWELVPYVLVAGLTGSLVGWSLPKYGFWRGAGYGAGVGFLAITGIDACGQWFRLLETL